MLKLHPPSKIYVGIDPGSVSLGLSYLDQNGLPLLNLLINPSTIGNFATVNLVLQHLTNFSQKTNVEAVVSIERYVAYKGAHNSASEIILMLIGALEYAMKKEGHEVLMFRAIDWKPNICKHLFKTSEYKNPYKSFDKNFSLSIVEHIYKMANKEMPKITHHEADAICLAYMGYINETKDSSKDGRVQSDA